MKIDLKFIHLGKVFVPLIEDGISWSTERAGAPGQLSFSLLKDRSLRISEGDEINLLVDGKKIFRGFVFTKNRDNGGVIKITAYDQLRYLKNKETYTYENKTASQLIKILAADFKLSVGEIEDTKFKIESRIEDNTTLFDMIQNALDATLTNKKQMYVLFDDYGKITLKNIGNMKLDLLIDKETGQNFDYTSSIDSNTYNKVKLIYNNEKTNKRDVYVAQHGKNMNKWGILQYHDTIQEGENGKEKANILLEFYNKKTRNISIKNAIGDVRVRAGTMLAVILELGDVDIQNYMIVEKCKHTFDNEMHTMDLTLRGGEFIV